MVSIEKHIPFTEKNKFLHEIYVKQIVSKTNKSKH